MPTKPRIAIIGAGPIGLEAALYARLKGCEVTVYERGRIAENVRQWGHVTMFSPFGMNSSEWGRRAVEAYGMSPPNAEAILTGNEYVEKYLSQIERHDLLRWRIRTGEECLAIARRHQLKTEHINDSRRGNTPLTLLMRNSTGERTFEAEVVIDCSGTFGHHNHLGFSGIACPGEDANRESICYWLPDLDSSFVTHARGEVLVVGSGFSAATTIVTLHRLRKRLPRFPLKHVYWLTRRPAREPIFLIEGDLLPERHALAKQANEIATTPKGFVEWIPGAGVQNIVQVDPSGRMRVILEWFGNTQTRAIEVDRIIANVGYRPDRSLYEELQVHECYATQGPMRLAAKLLGETSTDCLDQTSHGPEVLRNPEPNFYILGMKSYGRNSNFLIQVGLQQIVDVFMLIEQDWS